MKENYKVINQAFAQLLILMIEGESDNMELTFDFKKCKAKFKVDLVELEEKKQYGKC